MKIKIDRLSILVVSFIVIIVCLIYSKKDNEKIEITNDIKEFNYTLDNKDDYYQDLFKKLTSELNKDNINYDNYASLISKLFAFDFFSLNEKKSSNDIGGLQFIYSPFKDDFILLAKHSIYGNIGNTDKLPTVKNVDIIGIKWGEYSYLDKNDDNAYFVDVKINYDADLDYQTNIELILIHNDKKLEIVKMS